MEFYKYHSLGNDYLVYDIRKNREELDQERLSGSAAETLGSDRMGSWQDPMKKKEKSLSGFLIRMGLRQSREETLCGYLPII